MTQSADIGMAELSTPARLIAVATKLFFETGYASTTTRQISELSGIQKASLYYHYPQKEDLLFEICVSSLNDIDDALTRVLNLRHTESRLQAAVRSHIDQALTNVRAHSVMLLEMRSLSPERREQVADKRGAYESRIRELIKEGQANGELRQSLSDRKLTLALMDLVNWPIVWYREGGQMQPGDIADFLLDVYLNGARER